MCENAHLLRFFLPFSSISFVYKTGSRKRNHRKVFLPDWNKKTSQQPTIESISILVASLPLLGLLPFGMNFVAGFKETVIVKSRDGPGRVKQPDIHERKVSRGTHLYKVKEAPLYTVRPWVPLVQ